MTLPRYPVGKSCNVNLGDTAITVLDCTDKPYSFVRLLGSYGSRPHADLVAEPMSKSILIVDDSDTSRRITRLFLESQTDMEVCGEAVDGLDGIEKVKALKPDLILLDLAMPKMNGIEAASIMKRLMPKVRIIVFTVYDRFLGQSLASSVGVDAVLPKPDGGWKMIDCVRSLLQAA
jgi:CheY-like chemotaxis protein